MGERKFETEERGKKYHRVERAYGGFGRSSSLPDDASVGKVSAEVAVGEEPELTAPAILVQHVEGMLLAVELGGVEFAQVEHLALDDAVAPDAQAFTDGVIGVSFAVLFARAPFEKHAGRERSTEQAAADKGAGRHTGVLAETRAAPQALTREKI